MSMSLGAKVQYLRERQGYNRKELAIKAGLHPSHISLIENGGRSEVRPDTLDKLATALAVEKIYFLTDDPLEYLRVRMANLTPEEQARYLKMSPREREDFIQNELEGVWDVETLIEFFQVSQEDLLALTNPPAWRQEQEYRWEEYEKENWTDILMEEADKAGIAHPWMLAPQEYQLAVYRANKHGITGDELLKAVQLLISLRSEGELEIVSRPRPSRTPTTDAEIVLTRIWREAHGVETIGLHDVLSELDPDKNLLALQSASEAGIHLTLVDFMERSTIATLAYIWDKRQSGGKGTGSVFIAGE